MIAHVLTSLSLASARAHRREPVSGGSHGPPRTCYLEAIPQQPHRFFGAGDAPVRGTLRRFAKGQIC
jgi:hypothetical protein